MSVNSTLNHYPSGYEDEWLEPEQRPRDWKKVILVVGLGTLSWVATYIGMLELIQANMGALPLSTKIVVGFSVAMLMTMIIWLLDQMFSPLPFITRVAYMGGYVFLTLISVGFGFGFYWKVLESRSEATRSAESAVSQVQASLLAGASRLDQLQGTLDQLTAISSQKAIEERERGTSCPNSRPGDGPRRKLRDDDAARFSFAAEFVKGRSSKVKADMSGLDGDLAKIANTDPSTFDPKTGTRNKFMQALSRKLDLTATSFNAFRTDPQLRQIRSELNDRANRTTFPTSRGGTFSCPDAQLQSALFGVVKAIDQLPELGKPEIAAVEGAQAVVEAFRRLTTTFQGALAFKLPPSADELRAMRQKAVRSVANKRQPSQFQPSGNGLSQGGLSQRDYIPLSIAIFVDLCLLLVSIGRPMNRLGNLVPKMRDAERAPIYQILSKFDDIHRDEKFRRKFEVFRHVVFDFNGDYYVAVPLAAPRNNDAEELKNLQVEAHLLSNIFASFEKEGIFSRVYNPILTRNRIHKRLWRQGSKFANSQAFRVYRFRDGAWSDIILGAVMGAAKRANMERAREAREAGPQLTMPAGTTEQNSPERAEEIIRTTLSPAAASTNAQAGKAQNSNDEGADETNLDWPKHRKTANNNQSSASPVILYPERQNPRKNNRESNVSAAFGPYAAAVSGQFRADPAVPAAEEEINQHATASGPLANDQDDDTNIIRMPSTSPSLEAGVSDGKAESANTVPESTIIGPSDPEQAELFTQDQSTTNAPANTSLDAKLNVRITQRTADIELPVSLANGDWNATAEIEADTTSQGNELLTTVARNEPNAFGATNAHPVPLLLKEVDAENERGALPETAPEATTDFTIVGEVDDAPADHATNGAWNGDSSGSSEILSETHLEALSQRFAPARTQKH